MSIIEAKQSLDRIIKKARVHLYKPIQIAETLYRDRIYKDIDISDVETYRTKSRNWRDIICLRFLGRTSSSSSPYQDNIFNNNAIPPTVLSILSKENKDKNGAVEAYIYRQFNKRFTQMSTGLNYCQTHDKSNFDLSEFLTLFWNEPGLKRSIDKIYEIVVYSLFSALVEALNITVNISIDKNKLAILEEFKDFADRVINISVNKPNVILNARINRVGVTNAADRGLDMWANFGLAIQIKHLSLTEELAENIVSSISSDKIVIVCKNSEEKVIISLLNQIGWKSKIQSIITESDLMDWYNRALKGEFSDSLGDNVLKKMTNEILVEFPSSDNEEFNSFFNSRGYNTIDDEFWT
ncbi:MAG: HaeII family restriction endonuclease [Rikenellaceae bacterium]